MSINNQNIHDEWYEVKSILIIPIPRILSMVRKNDINSLMKQYKTKKIRIEKSDFQYDLLLIQDFKHTRVRTLIKKFQQKTIWPNDFKFLQNEIGNVDIVERLGDLQSLDNISCKEELNSGIIGIWKTKDFYLKKT